MNSTRARVQLSLDIPLPVCSDLTRAAHVNSQTSNQPATMKAPHISPTTVSLASETYNPFEPSPTHSHISLNYPIIPTKSTYPFPRTPTTFTPTHSPTLFEEFYNMAPVSPLSHSASRSLPSSPTSTIPAPTFQRVLKSQSNPSLKLVFEQPQQPQQPRQPLSRVKSFKQLAVPSPLSTKTYTPTSPTQVPMTPTTPTTPETLLSPVSITLSSPLTPPPAPTITLPVWVQATWTPTLPFAVQPLPCLINSLSTNSFVSPV